MCCFFLPILAPIEVMNGVKPVKMFIRLSL